jgi:hypothetical protein
VILGALVTRHHLQQVQLLVSGTLVRDSVLRSLECLTIPRYAFAYESSAGKKPTGSYTIPSGPSCAERYRAWVRHKNI